MSASRSRSAFAAGDYAGRTAVVATKHEKDRAIRPVFRERLGIEISCSRRLDTDALGTFTGEVDRPGDMLETVRQKAQLGLAETGADLGIASEGAYGPHPVIPFMASGTEVMIFVDASRSIEIVEHIDVSRTNFVAPIVVTDAVPDTFLGQTGFPEHALVVEPNIRTHSGREVRKGLTSVEALAKAVREMAKQSADGQAIVHPDMRAHMNPTRMAELGVLASKLADRINCRCERCGTPGFGPGRRLAGLPCELCDGPTRLLLSEIHVCQACRHEVTRPRADGKTRADPQYCDFCNP